MKEKILGIITELRDGAAVDESKALIDDEVLDSLELMELITELEDAFGITIGMEEIVPAHFNSVDAIAALIGRLKG